MKFSKEKFLTVCCAFFITTAFLVSCASESDSGKNEEKPAPTVVEVSSITLDKTEASLKVGESLTLTATVLPSNATNKTVTWSSSKSETATVTNGVVRAVSAGTAVITAKAGAKTVTCRITVSEIPAPDPEPDPDPETKKDVSITVTLPSAANVDSPVLQGQTSGSSVTVTCSSTYPSYSWKLMKGTSSETLSSTGNSVNVDFNDKAVGLYSIVLVATDSGSKKHSAFVNVEIK